MGELETAEDGGSCEEEAASKRKGRVKRISRNKLK
jgi:hypothetical protein